MKLLEVKAKFLTPMLGTVPLERKGADFALWPNGFTREDEVAAFEKMHEEQNEGSPDEDKKPPMTGFFREEGRPFIWDYLIKGVMKEALKALAMSDHDDFTNEKLKKLKLTPYGVTKTVDNQIFIKPRKIFLYIPEGSKEFMVQRPLRAQTMQGERVAIATSEAVPEGTTFQFQMQVLNSNLVPYVQYALQYAQLKGLGQWRNAAYGSFESEVYTETIDFEDIVVK